eukprot:CFRG5233T1
MTRDYGSTQELKVHRFSWKTALLYGLLFLFVFVLAAHSFTFTKHDKGLLRHHLVNYTKVEEAYWGMPTASIDWCEDNYQVSIYIAEFWNTLSSGVLSLCGLIGMYQSWIYGLESRFFVAYVSLFVVGLGSILFHTTLLYEYQMADELPMSWGALVWLYTVRNHHDIGEKKSVGWVPVLLFGIATTLFFYFVTQEYPAVFQIYIMAIIFYAVLSVAQVRNQLDQDSPTHHRARALFHFYVACGLCGFICWTIDRTQCLYLANLPMGIPNPQFHAWWHILMSINCYTGPIFVAYTRGLVLKRKPKLSLLPIALPRLEYTVDAEKAQN